MKATQAVRKIRLGAIYLALVLLAGCAQNMRDQSRLKPLEPNAFFADNQSARPIADNTVARGQLLTDEHMNTGMVDGQLATTFPFPVTSEVLQAGQQNYDIFCAPCHGLTGNGQGMIVERGFPAPPSLHSERLREVPVGHFFDVITNGFGRMYSYASRVSPQDRWAIAAYIRALQRSQNATLEDVPPAERDQLQGAAP